MFNPHQVTKDFESTLCDYTGAKYAVTVNSCTMALFLALKWHLCPYKIPYPPTRTRFLSTAESVDFNSKIVQLPKHTYCSVPMQINQNGALIDFTDEVWSGGYQLKPYPIWDYAKRFTSGMYRKGQFQCVSFSTTKILGIEQGGAVLHDSERADKWFRKMRFDGREEGVNPKDQNFDVIGHHMIMLPSIAAQLLLKLYHLPKVNADLPDFDYPALSKFEVFK